MGFYDDYNFEGMKFFSKIKTHPTIAMPCKEVLTIIEHLKKILPPINI